MVLSEGMDLYVSHATFPRSLFGILGDHGHDIKEQISLEVAVFFLSFAPCDLWSCPSGPQFCIH